MDNREQGVRFRVVIEISFPDANPWDPSDYDILIEKWRKSLEDSTLVNCKNVFIREVEAIGTEADDEIQREPRVSDAGSRIQITGGKTSRK